MIASSIRKSSLCVALGLTLGIAVAGSATIAVGAPAPGETGDSKASKITVEADPVSVANGILNQWQPIAGQLGLNASTWREIFSTQLSLMDPAIMARLGSVTPDASNAKASYAQFTQAFRNATMQGYMLAQSGDATNSKAQTKLGSPTNDQVFIPIVPCRVVDTRLGSGGSGPIAAGTQRAFYFFNEINVWSWQTSGPAGVPQGGAPGQAVSVCPGTTLINGGGTLGTVPPSAAMATITVVSPTAAGNLVAWGGAGTFPQSTVVNFTAGQNLANTTVIPWGGRLGAPVYDFTVRYNGPSGQADVVVDVVGYFVENKATALDCVTMYESHTVAAGSNFDDQIPACPTGYVITGAGCRTTGYNLVTWAINGMFSLGDSIIKADCAGTNITGSTISVQGTGQCCRIPGQ